MQTRNRYEYNGAVLLFGKCINDSWRGTTIAESKEKALSNLKFQYKTQHNKSRNSKIDLPGNLVCVD